MYTLDDYEKAKAELAHWQRVWENYTGNNPNKYHADIKAAAEKVRAIKQHLQNTGVLELSEKEKFEKELDLAFPNAKSKEIVEYKGKKYRRRFFPLEQSRSGKTVTAWGKRWELVDQ